MALTHEVSRVREILAAARLEHVRYAIRDVAVLAEQLAREGKEVLPLNIGDPLKFDFRTPQHLIEAVVKAMRDGKDGYRSEEHTSELQSLAYLVCRLLLEKKKN